MINEWAPTDQSASTVDTALLKRAATLAKAIRSDADQAAAELSDEEKSTLQNWLKLDEDAWRTAISQLEENELFPLAEFFTIAENAFSGWQCAAKNPAIWVFRYMKEQKMLPEKAAIRELKGLTDNRFIPYGSVL